MATAQTPVITAKQWREHKAQILSLYVDRNWPLRLVREELAAKGFEPSESQYRSSFKKWKVHKLSKSKITKKAPIMRSDKPKHMSDITAAKEASSVLPLTVEKITQFHHSPLENQEAQYLYFTSAADRNDSEDKNLDRDFVGLVVEYSKETVGETFYAQAHVGPSVNDNQISLEMGWDELEANQYQYGGHDL